MRWQDRRRPAIEDGDVIAAVTIRRGSDKRRAQIWIDGQQPLEPLGVIPNHHDVERTRPRNPCIPVVVQIERIIRGIHVCMERRVSCRVSGTI